MAYQSSVPVKIPPALDSHLAVRLEAILTQPDWLITAYDIPKVDHGVAIFGKSRRISGRPICAYVYTTDTHIRLERVKCSNELYEQIRQAVTQVLDTRTLLSS